MTVAIYVASSKDAKRMIPWGVKFAHADHTDLLIVCPKRTRSDPEWSELSRDTKSESPVHQAVFSVVDEFDRDIAILKEDIAKGTAGSSDLDRVSIGIREIAAVNPEESFSEYIAKSNVTLLLLSADNEISSQNAESNWRKQLFEQAPCETAFLRGPAPDLGRPFRILVATEGSPETEIALGRAKQLAQTFDGTVDVIYSRAAEDIAAYDLAQRDLNKLMRGVSKSDRFNPRVELGNSLTDVLQAQELSEYALVMVGSEKPRVVKSIFRGLESKSDAPNQYAVAVIRQSIPFMSRSWARLQAMIRSVVPQLDRDQRVDLLGKLTTTSRFDFDFIALISLSTLIAGLGLIRNSGAVVIGAMLVAPLMSPLMGAGFALIQSNVLLIKSALRSVFLGFALAFAIGVITGLLVPVVDVQNTEISGRGHPNLLDLVVALVSGVAGAYAIARPNLVGALPGVAIAAALVPPIATAGISLARLEVWLSLGALLLFLTNIFAIVLGTTFAFWAVGINNRVSKSKDGPEPSKWPRYLFFIFVAISFLLAILMDFIPEGTGVEEPETNESLVVMFWSWATG